MDNESLERTNRRRCPPKWLRENSRIISSSTWIKTEQFTEFRFTNSERFPFDMTGTPIRPQIPWNRDRITRRLRCLIINRWRTARWRLKTWFIASINSFSSILTPQRGLDWANKLSPRCSATKISRILRLLGSRDSIENWSWGWNSSLDDRMHWTYFARM